MTTHELETRLSNAEQRLMILRNRKAMLWEEYSANERELAECATRVQNLRDEIERSKWAVR